MASLVSSFENNSVLVFSPYQGLPVSTESAQKTFCALGADWWKQVFDGTYHVHGKMVFDEGLHEREKEPGFYESALKAFNFAKDNMVTKFTADFYCQLHKTACSHFQGKLNNTEMHSSKAGSFRNESNFGVRAGFRVRHMLTFFDRADLKDQKRRDLIEKFEYLRDSRGDEFTKCCADPSYYKRMNKYYEIGDLNSSNGEELEKLLLRKTTEITDLLLSLKNGPQFGAAAFPRLTLYPNTAILNYACPNENDFTFEAVVEHACSEFNWSIAEIDAELSQMDLSDKDKVEKLTGQKLILIADLYQKLEWFHPFPDGQGRTDLITLGMLLSKHGFSPAILDEPYVSSFAPLVDWVDYLKEGMKKWQEAAKASAIFHQSV